MKSWISKIAKAVRNDQSNLRDEGDKSRSEGDWKKAAAYYQAYLRQRPHDFDIWVQLGHANKEAGKFAKARAAYAEAIRLKPNDHDAYLNMGHLEKLAGAREKAIAAYMKSYILNQNNKNAFDELVNLNADLSELGDKFLLQRRQGRPRSMVPPLTPRLLGDRLKNLKFIILG